MDYIPIEYWGMVIDPLTRYNSCKDFIGFSIVGWMTINIINILEPYNMFCPLHISI